MLNRLLTTILLPAIFAVFSSGPASGDVSRFERALLLHLPITFTYYENEEASQDSVFFDLFLGDNLGSTLESFCIKHGLDDSSCSNVATVVDQTMQEWLVKQRSVLGLEQSPLQKLGSVNSFDIFDTIIARDVEHPQDIFSLVEEQYPFPRFRELRIYAESISSGGFHSIYEAFQSLTGISMQECDAIRSFELQMEINHTYLIQETYHLVQDGDILVSEMYLGYNDIQRILAHAGFTKRVNVFVSDGGKRSGWLWPPLFRLYDIKLHRGDNFYSDVQQAFHHGINRLDY